MILNIQKKTYDILTKTIRSRKFQKLCLYYFFDLHMTIFDKDTGHTGILDLYYSVYMQMPVGSPLMQIQHIKFRGI